VHVDEVDQRRNHDRGQRRIREIFEQPGEEQQRDDSEDGDNERGEL